MRSGTSRVTVARLEWAGRDVRLGTITSICGALGLEVAAVPAGGEPALETLLAREREKTRRLERRLAHAALAARLLAARSKARPLVRVARAAVDRWEREGLCSRHYVVRWRAMLAGPVERVARALLDAGDWQDALFQNTPFTFAFEQPGRDAGRPAPPVRAGARPVRRDGLRGARKPRRAGPRRHGTATDGRVDRRRCVLEERPGAHLDLAPALGQGSAFDLQYGYYLDPISPRVATLPARWEGRLTGIQLEPALAAWFLEPHDAVVEVQRSRGTGSGSGPACTPGCCRSRSWTSSSPGRPSSTSTRPPVPAKRSRRTAGGFAGAGRSVRH